MRIADLVVVLFITGFYTGVFLYITDDIYVPYALCGLSAMYFGFRNAMDVRSSHVKALLFIGLASIMGLFLCHDAAENFVERFKGILQLLYSISICYLFYLNLVKWPKARLSKLCFIFSSAILFGTFLEVYTPLRAISDDFRYAVFRRAIYESDLRDIQIYGQLRPRLFTQEPSYVAVGYTILLSCWAILSDGKMMIGILLSHLAFAAYFIRSPIVFMVLPMVLFAAFSIKGSDSLMRGVRKEKAHKVKLLIAVVLIGLLLFGLFGHNLFFERIARIRSGQDYSFAARITGPLLMAFKVIQSHPLFGSGVAGKESVENQILDSFWELGYTVNTVFDVNANYLLTFIMYFGLVGGIIFIAAFGKLITALGVRNWWFVLGCNMIMSQTIGSFEGARTWTIIFLILIVERKSSEYPMKTKATGII